MGRPKKILVTGAGGLLGAEFRELSRSPNPCGFEIIPLTHPELDITDPSQIETAFEKYRPDFLINCAAYMNVDRAEGEKEQARKINVEGLKILAESCLFHQIKLVHFSTDNVFDGLKKIPYLESDKTQPANFYGLTKLEGEDKIREILPEKNFLILRITWPYGKNGKNFINQILNNLRKISSEKKELRVVTDHISTPNPAFLIAKSTLQLLDHGATGLFHLTCSGSCSKYELICSLFKSIPSQCRIIPVSSKEFPSSATRPPFAVLGTERKDLEALLQLPPWREALEEYIEKVI